MSDTFTTNSVDPVKQTINVTFTVGGINYPVDVPITPYMNFNDLNKALIEQLLNMQSMVILFNSFKGYNFTKSNGSITVTPKSVIK